MPDLDVNALTVPQLLEKLHGRHFLVPMFQRPFVWTAPKVAELADSVLKKRPIGMLTLWEQPFDSELTLEPVDLPDRVRPTQFATSETRPQITKYAILDGRQRCTALAMAFGGLRQKDNSRRYAGQFFLDLDADNDQSWVRFLKTTEITRRNMGAPAAALAEGLMPLAVDCSPQGEWDISVAWDAYIFSLLRGEIYGPGLMPASEVIDRRIKRIQDAREGVASVKLATYTVGAVFGLGDICDIFETLNTTGVKVSTVDLIHTWLFAESLEEKYEGDAGFELRAWLDDMSETPGAEGWASSEKRPEWIAQLVTAAYVGMHEKPDVPRAVRNEGGAITSIKAPDLLRVPFAHWRHVADHMVDFAALLGDFQQTVAGGFFPGSDCPYPATSSVYLGLAWSKKVEEVEEDRCWGAPELAALYRAFFWANALTTRYDQGFLTQVGADIQALRLILRSRGTFSSLGAWVQHAQSALDTLIKEPLPSEETVTEWLLDGSTAGAKRLATRLLLWTRTTNDLVTAETISFPHRKDVEMHHIWPKSWLSNNQTQDLKEYLKHMSDRGLKVVDSPANLMPLSRDSNQSWSAANPGQILLEKRIGFDAHGQLFESAFIDKRCFELLSDGQSKLFGEYVERRAELIAKAMLARARLTVG